MKNKSRLYAGVLFLFAALFTYGTPSLADDTIYCPKNKAECQKKCAYYGKYVRDKQPFVDKWDKNLKRSNTHIWMPVGYRDHHSYKIFRKNVKRSNSYNYGAKNMRVYGTYSGPWQSERLANGRYRQKRAVYVYVKKSDYKYDLRHNPRYKNSRRSDLKRKVNKDVQDSKTIQRKIPNKLKPIKKKLQHAYLFRAQCCGYRWMSDVDVSKPNKPTKPTKPSNCLLGVCPGAATSSSNAQPGWSGR